MAADGYGTKGEPEFDDAGAPDTAVDPTLVAQYAGIVGNRIVGTAADRAAFSSIWPGFTGGPWNGLVFYETDTGLTYRRVSGSWVAETALANISTFGTGVTATAGAQYTPRVRRTGDLVHLFGGITLGVGAAVTTNLFTVPSGYLPVTAGTRPIGVGVSSTGIGYELFMNGATGVVTMASGYTIGSIATGAVLPLHCFWWLD